MASKVIEKRTFAEAFDTEMDENPTALKRRQSVEVRVSYSGSDETLQNLVKKIMKARQATPPHPTVSQCAAPPAETVVPPTPDGTSFYRINPRSGAKERLYTEAEVIDMIAAAAKSVEAAERLKYEKELQQRLHEQYMRYHAMQVQAYEKPDPDEFSYIS